MARIGTFVYCEDVKHNMAPNGSKLNVIGPMLVLTPMFIPSMFSFSVLIGIIDVDLDKPHVFKFIFKAPEDNTSNKEPVNTGDIPISVKNKQDLPKDMQNFIIDFDFKNIPLESEGLYVGQVYFDGELLGEYPINAKMLKKEVIKNE